MTKETNKKFDWSQIPQNSKGFVNYSVIKSQQVRLLIMVAEVVKLKEELKAREKWVKTEANLARIAKINQHLDSLSRRFAQDAVH